MQGVKSAGTSLEFLDRTRADVPQLPVCVPENSGTDAVTLAFRAQSAEPLIYRLDDIGEHCTVEDVMEESRRRHGLSYTVEVHPQYGKFLQQVAFHEGAVPHDKSIGSSSGPGPWWMLYLDRNMAEQGMSKQAIHPGQRIDWCYGERHAWEKDCNGKR
jgi:hypothetical protein